MNTLVYIHAAPMGCSKHGVKKKVKNRNAEPRRERVTERRTKETKLPRLPFFHPQSHLTPSYAQQSQLG